MKESCDSAEKTQNLINAQLSDVARLSQRKGLEKKGKNGFYKDSGNNLGPDRSSPDCGEEESSAARSSVIMILLLLPVFFLRSLLTSDQLDSTGLSTPSNLGKNFSRTENQDKISLPMGPSNRFRNSLEVRLHGIG